MATTNTYSRSLQELGAAAWFGGSLMGAIGVNGGAATASDPTERARIASAGWAKWVPVNAVAIGADLVGGVGQIMGNKGRIMQQRGVLAATAAKTAVTAAALGATAYARVLGKRIEKSASAPTEGVTEPGIGTPPDLAAAQRQEKVMQWAVPALTGALIVMQSRMGEQQRPMSVIQGMAGRLAMRH